VSRPILLEYQELLSRPELNIRKVCGNCLMQFIRSHSYSVVPKSQSRITPDPGDDKLLECADQRAPIIGWPAPAACSDVVERKQGDYLSGVHQVGWASLVAVNPESS